MPDPLKRATRNRARYVSGTVANFLLFQSRYEMLHIMRCTSNKHAIKAVHFSQNIIT
jgi:hypothetical protein